MKSMTITPAGRSENKVEEAPMLRVRAGNTFSGNNEGCAYECCSDGACSTHTTSFIVPEQYLVIITYDTQILLQ